jgi:hypothetical protein
MSHRKHFLQSATTLLALPAMESLGFKRFASAAEKAPVKPPKRLAFIAMGYGVTKETWFPKVKKTTDKWELSEGLMPLKPYQKDFTMVQGMWNQHNIDGHNGTDFWLTGANRYAVPGVSFNNTISADQVAAEQLGVETRFNSIHFSGSCIGTGSAAAGHGVVGSIAWDRSGRPLPSINDPMKAFHYLFSKPQTPIEEQMALLAEERSVLDLMRQNARMIQHDLTKTDKMKLEEYLDSIRDIEKRLSKELKWIHIERPEAPFNKTKANVRGKGKTEIRLIYDLMVAAFQTDSTRVSSYRLPVQSLIKSVGYSIGSHPMSHYYNATEAGPEGRLASEARDLEMSRCLAYLISKLKNCKESDGSTLYDNIALTFGGNISTGHILSNCPTILVGKGAGLKMGHHIMLKDGTPLCNAWLTIIQGLGIDVDQHGDSTGTLQELIA